MLASPATCAVVLSLAASLVILLIQPQASSPPPPQVPHARLKWLGASVEAVDVCGDWNGWQRPCITLERENQSRAFAADLFLPDECPHGNLVLCRLRGGRDPGHLTSTLADAGVLIKNVSAVPGLEGCLRISIGTATELDLLERCLPRALA